MVQAKRSRPSQDIAPTHPGAAAIDIGATMHVAAVDPDQDPDQPVRSFGTFTVRIPVILNAHSGRS